MKKQSLLLLIAFISGAHAKDSSFTVVNNTGEIIFVTAKGNANATECNNSQYPGSRTGFCYYTMGARDGWEICPAQANPDAPGYLPQNCIAVGQYTGGSLNAQDRPVYVYTKPKTGSGKDSTEWKAIASPGDVLVFPSESFTRTESSSREQRDPLMPLGTENPIIMPGGTYYPFGSLGTVTNATTNLIFTIPDYANGWTLGIGANVVNRPLTEVSKVDWDGILVKNATTSFNYDQGKITFIFNAQSNTMSIYHWSKSKACTQQYRLDLNALQKAYQNMPRKTVFTFPWTINPTFNGADGSLSFSVDVNGVLFDNNDLVQKGILVEFIPATCPTDAQSN